MKRLLAAMMLLDAGVRTRARRTSRSPSPSTRRTRPSQSGADRFSFINRLAQQVTSVAGVPAVGKAFARSSDLEAAIRKHEVALRRHRRRLPRRARRALRRVGDGHVGRRRRAALGAVQRLGDPGRRAAGQEAERRGDGAARRPSSPRTRCSTASCRLHKFFAAQAKAPDIASAVAAVSLHKADAVFAPESEGRGLQKVFDVRDRVPNPAFCEVASGPVVRPRQQGEGGGARARRRRLRPRWLEGVERGAVSRARWPHERARAPARDGRARRGAYRGSGRAGAAVAGAGDCRS